MKIHRFFLDHPIAGEHIEISNTDLVHQWRNVFRFNVGHPIVVFDGSGFEYDALIETLSNNREAQIRILEKREGIVPFKKITLYQSLIKKDNMEWIVQKATELGVSKIVPIISERSEKKGFNIERARKIAIEASEQCGRADVPEILPICELPDALDQCELGVVFDGRSENSFELRAKSLEVREASSSKPKALSLFVGSEGGWTASEINLFKEKGFNIYKLGNLTLRAETATIVALSLVSL